MKLPHPNIVLVLSGKEIDDQKLIDQHYYAIASKATILKPVELNVDATAGIGVASRRGAGRIRHIATPTLWLQVAVSDGKVSLSKIAGTVNPADLGMKYVDKPTINRALIQCGFVCLHGRSAKALKAAV